MRPSGSGALGALRGFGRTLKQQEGQAQPAPKPAGPPSLADLARARGKGGVEQTKAPVEVKARDVEPDTIHPQDSSYKLDKKTGRWVKRTVSTTGKALPKK